MSEDDVWRRLRKVSSAFLTSGILFSVFSKNPGTQAHVHSRCMISDCGGFFVHYPVYYDPQLHSQFCWMRLETIIKLVKGASTPALKVSVFLFYLGNGVLTLLQHIHQQCPMDPIIVNVVHRAPLVSTILLIWHCCSFCFWFQKWNVKLNAGVDMALDYCTVSGVKPTLLRMQFIPAAYANYKQEMHVGRCYPWSLQNCECCSRL